MTKKSQNKKKPPKPRGTQKMRILGGVGKYSSRSGQRKLKGRGGYAEDIGSSIGSWLGKKAGGLFSSITGLGHYEVNHNSLLKASASDPPMISNTKSATRVQHREYIQDISGSIDFQIQSFPVNPGLSGTFPWLASVANAFEQYRMHGILFEFKSLSATALNSTDTALGAVIMATEYNPLHGNFTAKRDMENYVYSTSERPSISQLHPIECARDVSVLDELFVRNVPLTGSDLRFSDIGNFQIATVGMQAAATIGELWVTYDIELIKPKLPDAFSSIGPAHYAYSTGTPAYPPVSNGSPTIANYFGDANSQKYTLLGTGVSPVTLDTNTITFNQVGRYMLMMTIQGTSAAVIAPTLIYGTAMETPFISVIPGALNYEVACPVNGVASIRYELYFFAECKEVSGGGNTVVLSGGILPTTATSSEWFVLPLPHAFSTPKRTESSILFELINTLQKQVTMLQKNLPASYADSDEEYKEDILTVFETEPLQNNTSTSVVAHEQLSRSTMDLVQLIQTKMKMN